MITCKLGGKEYHIDFISGRALREIGAAQKAYRQIIAAAEAVQKGETAEDDQGEKLIVDTLDTLVKWFCVVFNHQFTPDEVYDGYPSDKLMHDLTFAMLAVQNQMTEVLTEFPMNPAAKAAKA